MEAAPVHGRVLSISSHVVSGFVGNKCAVFALQLLGFNVDSINTVSFSNHTGYKGGFKGERMTREHLDALIEGLENNHLFSECTAIYTGYIGNLPFLDRVLRLVEQLRVHNPNLKFLCDPVMGDQGVLYVKPELVPVFRSTAMQLADIITPNQFECDTLLERKITTQHDALIACEELHQRGPAIVLITSLTLEDGSHSPDQLLFIGSRKLTCPSPSSSASAAAASAGSERVKILIPKIDGIFTGTGDTFASLFLGFFITHPDDFVSACEKAVNAMHAILRLTPPGAELRLVEARKLMETPPMILRAEKDFSTLPF